MLVVKSAAEQESKIYTRFAGHRVNEPVLIVLAEMLN